MDRDGKNARMLAQNATRPSWGPNGKVIVYTQQAKGNQTLTCVHNLETGQVTYPTDKWKSWLRSGGEAVFASSQKRLALGGKLWTTTSGVLMVLDLDEKYEPVKLTPLGKGYFGCNPQWSASGERLYFAHHDPKYNGAILLWSIKPDGTDARRFETPAQDRWDGYGIYCESPDGTLMAYSRGGDIWVMRLADGAEVRLTENQGQNGAPRWHPGTEGISR
jgi:Tol biopolymer transport system component